MDVLIVVETVTRDQVGPFALTYDHRLLHAISDPENPAVDYGGRIAHQGKDKLSRLFGWIATICHDILCPNEE